MIKSLMERIERMADEGIRVSDIPFVAIFVLAAIIVLGGEVGCIMWSLAIMIMALINGAAVLLQLIPCTILFSIFTAIIIYAYQHEEDNF